MTYVDPADTGFLLAEDGALKTKLSGITVSDQKNATRPVPVVFRFAQGSLRKQTYPVISISRHSVTYDSRRDHVGVIDPVHNPSTGLLDVNDEWRTEFPLPVLLFYHIDFFTTSNQHHVQLTSALLHPTKLPLHNGLLYIAETDTQAEIHVRGYQDTSFVDQTNRAIYRTTIPVHVEAYLLKAEILAVTPVDEVSVTLTERTDL